MRFQLPARTRRPFTLIVLWMTLFSVIVSSRAAAQTAPSPLAAISAKATLSAADKAAIRARVAELANALAAADDKAVTAAPTAAAAADKERDQARLKLIGELKIGTPAFRAEAAAAAASPGGLMPRVAGPKMLHAIDAALVLVDLDHAATRNALVAALASQYPSVRYQAARGLRGLQPLLTDPAAYKPVIGALSEACRKESNPIALRALYDALNFSANQKNFRGQADVAAALAEILTARMARADGARLVLDLPGIRIAGKVAADLKQPHRALAAAVARRLLALARTARDDADSGLADSVAECEAALHAVIDKHSGPEAARAPRIADQLRGKPDPAKLNAAIGALFGAKSRPGVMNKAPWNMPAT